MALDYIQLSMEITGVIILSIFGFYAIKLLATFRHGKLEKGWRNVTEGAIILVLAQIPFLISPIAPAAFDSLLAISGTAIRFIGIVFLILGFRSQYQVWRIDNGDLSPVIESSNPN